jgi:hypothetical protein
MSDKKNNKSNASTRLAGAAILMVAVTGVPALAQTAPEPAERHHDDDASFQRHHGDHDDDATFHERERVVTITNHSKDAMVLGTPEWPTGFERGAPVPGECKNVLPAGDHCELPIRFVPSQVGRYSGDLVIPVNAGEQFVVRLTGTGIAKKSDAETVAGARDEGARREAGPGG